MATVFFFLLAFISELVGTLSGFGSSVFFVPLAGMFFDFKTTLALTGIIHIFSTSAQVYLFRKDIHWKLALKIGIPSVLFVLLGAYLNAVINVKYAQLAMGIFLILFSLTFLLYKNARLQPTNFNAIAGGILSGFLAGLIGTGGAVRGATLAAFDLKKGMFIGTSSAIDFVVDLSRSIVYLSNGYLESQYYWYVPVLFVMASAGAYTGKLILNRISDKTFKRVVLAIIFLVGISMIYGFLNARE